MPQKLLKSTSTVSFFTLLSRIMGFARDVILANIFGASATFDAFVIAFRLPNFLRRLFGEGAFAQAFVPILSEKKTHQTHEEIQDFVNHVSGTLAGIVTIVVLLAEIFAPLLIMVFAPGFLHDPARFHLAVHMLRIMFPYLLLIVLMAFAGAVLNTFGKFAAPAFAPVLLNISLIGVALLWAPQTSTPIYVLAWGVILGGILQLAVQLPALRKIKLVPRLRWGIRDPNVRRVIRRMMPALFGVSVAQISILIDNVFASFLQSGSISWLYYSERLIYFPLGVIGVALATVIMPYLSKQHAENDTKIFSETLDWALRCTLFIGLPAAIGMFILSGPILATLLHYGKFNTFDVIMTRKSLRAFAIGLPAFMLIKILASAFYAKQNIGTPVKIAVIALVINLIFNAALIVPLQHAGLALATSIAAITNAAVLWVLLIRQGVFTANAIWRKTIIQLLIASAVMTGLVEWLNHSLSVWLAWPALMRITHLLIILCVGIISYSVSLRLMGVKLKHFRAPC